MLSKLSFRLTLLASQLASRLRNNFYLYLAALLSCGVLLDASVFHIGENMKQKAFDFMVRSRVVTPKPDPDIVIVDVNEASLAAMAADYGRWPWPRQVFGEFLEHLEQQKPKAVVFDILFSDADIYNPDSDAYFNDAVAATDNVYFPFLRLEEQHDSLSEVKPMMIPGITAIGAQPQMNATIAVVLPHFQAALKAGRLGIHNIYPDPDGIVRDYRLFRDDYGWKLPSLPLVIGQELGYRIPDEQNMLVNWRGGPFTYHSVSFSDVYRDMSAKKPKRPRNEFSGKIVIIGSTAPALFDLKATAMSKQHPGVEILATAIDNIKHGDYLHFWRGTAFYMLMSLLLIWVTAGAFFRNVDRTRFDKAFGLTQTGLLAISYVGINLSNTYIDLTGPVTWAVAYFGIAKAYALIIGSIMQDAWAQETKEAEISDVWLMPILLETQYPIGSAQQKMLYKLNARKGAGYAVEAINGTQAGIWGLFSGILVVRWIAPLEGAVEKDADTLIGQLPVIAKKQGITVLRLKYALLHTEIHDRKDASSQWRNAFAQAIIQLETSPHIKEFS